MRRRALALLTDRRRRQRGSVLSAVLIITAFIAIIASALMTELSTNFLLSRDLGSRVADEATMNSAVELTLSQMLSTQLNSPCPANPGGVTLNARTAAATYVSCWPTVDSRTQPAFSRIVAGSSAFSIDGTHAQLPGLNDYLIANAGGYVYDFTFGGSAPRWTLQLAGQSTAPGLVMANPHVNGQFIDVIPMSGSVCSPSPYCLIVRSDNGQAAPPQPFCTYPLTSPVLSRPAPASSANPGLIYFGSGNSLYAVDVSTGGGQCDWEANVTIASPQPVLAGPLAFLCASSCGSNTDEIYALTSDTSSSHLVRYTYRNGNLASQSSITLPASAAGMVASGTSLPASAALTFRGGNITVIQLSASGAASVGASTAIPAGISDAPYWCGQCGNVIGVGGQDGGLYLFNSNLSTFATYAPPGPAIQTTPGADGAGNWYFGAADGYVYELQAQSGQTLTMVRRYGPMAAVASSVQVGGCPTGICVYLGDWDNNAYLIPLDARDAVITACITAAPPACASGHPRLWASVEVGAGAALQTVHVGGWSYF